MGRPKKHVPLPSCTDGMFAFDGGAFNLATHEVWAVCRNPGCRVENCFGRFAAEYGDAVFRVRNRRDLKKHLSPDGSDLAATTPVLVVPKHTLKGRPTAEDVLTGKGLTSPAGMDLVAATGSISVRQARTMDRFPITPSAAEEITRLCFHPVASTYEAEVDADKVGADKAVQARNRNHLELMVSRHGIHYVTRMFARHQSSAPDGSAPTLGLVVDLVAAGLADRNGVGRMGRVYVEDRPRSLTSDVVRIIPSAELESLNPLPGQGVTGRLTAAPNAAATSHAALRLFDRVYRELTPEDAKAALRGLPLDHETLATAVELRANLRTVINDLLSEGVFSTGIVDAPVPDAKKRLIEGVNGRGGSRGSRPSLHSDQVAVTCPHPFSPNHVLYLIGGVGAPTVDRRTQVRSHEFTLRTVLVLPREGKLLEEISAPRPAEESVPASPHRKGKQGKTDTGARRGPTYTSVPHMVSAADDLLTGEADKYTHEQESRVISALGFDR